MILTTDDIFQPIVSLSTTDKKMVELLVAGRMMTGFFDGDHWACNGGKSRMPEGLYPSHWRPLHEENCPGHVASGNPKVCAHCGTHIDSMRPLEDELSEISQ